MKKHRFIFKIFNITIGLALILFIGSCREDDDSENQSNNQETETDTLPIKIIFVDPDSPNEQDSDPDQAPNQSKSFQSKQMSAKSVGQSPDLIYVTITITDYPITSPGEYTSIAKKCFNYSDKGGTITGNLAGYPRYIQFFGGAKYSDGNYYITWFANHQAITINNGKNSARILSANQQPPLTYIASSSLFCR